ncbi:MAG TPA: hypothetical protein VHZ55_31435 [Bryobacteraceae bacterium]|nr:hypothetical protein [Bryobacteraceae bacterium]
MQFAYDGFSHVGECRRFLFRSRDDQAAVSTFCISVKLSLLSEHGVLVQDGPQFCLHMLEKASTGEPCCLDQFHSYDVMSEDFRPLLVERERKLAEKAMKTSLRRPIRKPQPKSNLFLGHVKATV